MSQHYELLLIISPKVEENKHQSLLEQITKLITDGGGSITKQDIWGKRKLAYEIAKEAYGFYVLMEFDLGTDNYGSLNKAFQLMPEVMRYVIVKKHVKSAEELEREKRIQEKVRAEQERQEREEQAAIEQEQKAAAEKEKTDVAADQDVKTEEKKRGKEPKISLEDLDEKLDEILKEDV